MRGQERRSDLHRLKPGQPAKGAELLELVALGEAVAFRLEDGFGQEGVLGGFGRGASGALEPVSWDEALATVAEAIRKAPAATHILGGDPGEFAVIPVVAAGALPPTR